MAEPSDDADIPIEIPGATLTLPPFFSFSLASLDPRLTVQVAASSAKRSGEPLYTGSNTELRTAEDNDNRNLAVALESFGIVSSL